MENFNDKIIETFSGRKARRSECRKIKGQYYKMNEQCFLINNRWHRIDNGLIVYNYSAKEYILKSSIEDLELILGIVGFDDNGTVIFGYFNENNDCVDVYVDQNAETTGEDSNVEKESHYVCISEKVAKSQCFERISDGIFIMKRWIKDKFESSKKMSEYLSLKKRGSYNFRINYNSSHRLHDFIKTHENDFVYDKKYPFAKFLGKTTFGIEFETSNGHIPERKLYKNGLIACRDGSIGGHEYVTIPLMGEKGLASIDSICDLLVKYTEINHDCSMHMHFGNRELSKEYVIAVYRTIFAIQNEIYELFPEYYRQTSRFKRRDYNNPLPALNFIGNIESDFNEIYSYLLGQSKEWEDIDLSFKGFLNSEHPLDTDGNHKWNVEPRYHLYNLVPLIWGNRGTVEARIHTPTRNKIKVVSWLFINNAILEFAMANKKAISENKINMSMINLESIISSIYNECKELAEYINGYIFERKAIIKNANKSSDGKIGINEVNEDYSFKFSTNKTKTLL